MSSVEATRNSSVDDEFNGYMLKSHVVETNKNEALNQLLTPSEDRVKEALERCIEKFQQNKGNQRNTYYTEEYVRDYTVNEFMKSRNNPLTVKDIIDKSGESLLKEKSQKKSWTCSCSVTVNSVKYA